MKTRPIFNCRDSISEKGSEFLSEILDTIHEDPENINVKSTEEVQAKIMELNKKLEQYEESIGDDNNRGKMVVLSQDAEALYVKIQPAKAAKEVEDAIIESKWTIEADHVEVGKYLAVNMERTDIIAKGLDEVIPSRNMKIGMTNPEMNSKSSNIPVKLKAKYILDIILEETAKRGEQTKREKAQKKEYRKVTIACGKCKNGKYNKMSLKTHIEKFHNEQTKSCRSTKSFKKALKKVQEKVRKIGIIKENETEWETINRTEIENREKNDEKLREKGKTPKPKKDQWVEAKRYPRKDEQKRMVAMALGICVRIILENHCYETQGKTFKQDKLKGSIGLNLQRSVASIYIANWGRKYKKLLLEIQDNTKALEKNQQILLEALLMIFYVDDNLEVRPALPPGAVYDTNTNSVRIDNSKIESDKEVPADVRTCKLVEQIANSIDETIIMTAECPSMHPENGFKLPYLDMALWVEDNKKNSQGKILFSHYTKPMASKLVIQKTSAIGKSQKRTILTQEGIRMLRNTHPDLPDSYREEDMSTFAKKLQNSGYDEKERLIIIRSAMNGYNKQVKADQEGTKPLYRPREWNQEAREEQKKNKKVWFKRGGYEYVAFIPATPGSELKKNIEEAIESCNQIKVKVVEHPGQKLVNVMKMSTKKCGEGSKCEEKYCLMCSQEKSGNCRTSEILYQIECLDCKACLLYTSPSPRDS